MNHLFYYESSSLSPYRNLGVEEVLAGRLRPGEACLYLWRNACTVVIGKHQNPYCECRLERLESDGVHLARRKTGGGAVFHDEGNLNFTFLNRREDYEPERNFRILQDALRRVGVSSILSGRNDLSLEDGRKFCGNAFLKGSQTACHHGTLMIGVNLERLSHYLRVNPLKLQSKAVGSVRSRVVNLAQVQPALRWEDLAASLKSSCAAAYGLPLEEVEHLDAGQVAEAEKFYSSPQWIYGEKFRFTSSVERRFDWGMVTLSRDSRGRVHLYSDALDMELVEYLQTQLKERDSLIPIPVLFSPLQQKMIADVNNLLSQQE